MFGLASFIKLVKLRYLDLNTSSFGFEIPSLTSEIVLIVFVSKTDKLECVDILLLPTYQQNEAITIKKMTVMTLTHHKHVDTFNNSECYLVG